MKLLFKSLRIDNLFNSFVSDSNYLSFIFLKRNDSTQFTSQKIQPHPNTICYDRYHYLFFQKNYKKEKSSIYRQINATKSK